MTETYEKCSCGSRQKSKCVRESDSGYGKMCFKEFEPIPEELIARINVIREKAEDNKAIDAIRGWSEDFASKQETLPVEFQQVLADNIWELYET